MGRILEPVDSSISTLLHDQGLPIGLGLFVVVGYAHHCTQHRKAQHPRHRSAHSTEGCWVHGRSSVTRHRRKGAGAASTTTTNTVMSSSQAAGFFRACQDGNEAEVLRLLGRDAALVHRRDHRGGWTGLMLAAKFGFSRIVRLLLDQGADPLSRNQFSASALHWAAVGGSIDIVEMLLAAAKQAARGDTPNAAIALLNGGDTFGTTPLIGAARHGQEEVVMRLLREPGIDVDARDKDGMSATWRVACWGKANVLRLLLTEGGADFALSDKGGRKPIDVARDLDRHQCVALLLEAERGYALWKARRLKEEALLRRVTLPAWWGKGRARAPEVEVLASAAAALPAEQEELAGACDDQDQDEEGEEEQRALAHCVAVTMAVLDELPLDVFQELSEYL